jgi:hypothetical protein
MIMTDALAMYKGVLFELNKFQSADFDIEDFNYFMPDAVEKWLKAEIDQYETTQKVTDKISCLIKLSAIIVLNSDNSSDVREFNIPEDYRHFVSCQVRLRYKQATPVHSVNAKRHGFTKRFTGDNKVNILDNYYLKPLVSDSDLRLYHRLTGKKVSILFDTEAYPNAAVTVESAQLEYISIPQAIELNEDYTIKSNTQFPEHANREIVKVCAGLFLENNQSQRLQTHSIINN